MVSGEPERQGGLRMDCAVCGEDGRCGAGWCGRKRNHRAGEKHVCGVCESVGRCQGTVGGVGLTMLGG